MSFQLFCSLCKEDVFLEFMEQLKSDISKANHDVVVITDIRLLSIGDIRCSKCNSTDSTSATLTINNTHITFQCEFLKGRKIQ